MRAAARLLNTVQQSGATLGPAVLGSVYLSGAAPSGGPSAAMHAVEAAFQVAAGLVLVAFASARRM
ncbi:hypothetical protein [Streptomyces spiralis]